MGESIVETPKVENKMGESVTNVPYLQQSVSFGRFERDSLCWERWSTFPTNKYLEEVEKCSTPGSVAQKKAYFEAHYKKIAARTAELLLDQERKREAELVNEDSAVMSSLFKISEEELDNEKADTDNFVDETDQRKNEVGSFDSEGSIENDHMKSNIADMFVQENEMGSFDTDLSAEHFHVKSDSADGFNQENDVLDLPSRISGQDDGVLIVINVSELSNVISEKCEDVDEFKGGDNTVDEASEVVKMEVTKDIHELNDGADAIDEIVKSEVTEHFDESDDRTDMIKGNEKQPQEEFASVDLCPTSKIPDLVKWKAPALVIEDVPSILESKGEELPQEKVKRTIVEEESGSLMKLVISKRTQKAALVKKTNSTTNTHKRLASPVPTRTSAPMPKSPMPSTPKLSKPELTKVAKSASRLFDKKEHGFTPLSVKKTFGPQSKRIVPTSLHMSLSFGPTNPDPASLTMRKSLIMERMGDKDIVKRAFKAFQNAPQMSPSSLVKSPAINQFASRKAEQKGSPANIFPKKNEGIGKAPKTASTLTGQQGTRKSLMSPGVNKNGGAEQRNVKSVAASFGPRVQLQGKNQKDVSKKLEARTNVLDATDLQSKLKVEKAAPGKKPSHSINSKPKLPSSYNHRHGGSVHKEGGKASG